MEKIGSLFVDAGIVMVGDPCYTLPDDASHREEVAKDWSKFCDATFANGLAGKGYSKPLGDGTSIVVESGYGDGEYPVYVERDPSGRISRLVVEFINEDEDDEDEDDWGDEEE